MAVNNRTLDLSEQRKVFEITTSAIATGVTQVIGMVPFPSVLEAAQIAAYGTSGTPTYQLNVDRFIAGSGFTTIILATGSSNTPAAFGTSGVGAFGTSLFGASGMVTVNTGATATNGSTLGFLLPNDVLVLTSGGSNAAAKALVVGVVLRPLQDTKIHFGLK